MKAITKFFYQLYADIIIFNLERIVESDQPHDQSFAFWLAAGYNLLESAESKNIELSWNVLLIILKLAGLDGSFGSVQ